MTEPDVQALSIRFPTSVYERLRRAGFDHRVPMNTIVVGAVEQILDDSEALSRFRTAVTGDTDKENEQ
jgi:hypothetical protein